MTMKKFFTALWLIAGVTAFILAINYFVTGNSYGKISFLLLLIIMLATVGVSKSK